MSRTLNRLIPAALAATLAAASPALARQVVIAVDSNMPHLDPANTNDTLSQSVERTMYQGLYAMDRHMKLVPGLATSYQASPDAKVFTFHLRKGVTFQDGTPFDAAAVKATIERLANVKNHLSRRSLVSMVQSVEVIDPLTVKITLATPFGAFLNNMAHPGTFIISPTALKKWGKDIATHPVGTGPFKFVSFHSDKTVTAKNPNYWRPGLPKVDGITFQAVPENGARYAMLLTGEAQFIAPMPVELMAAAIKNPKIRVVQSPSIIARYLAMNNMRKPFSDIRVREALNYAIDKKTFVKVVFGGYGQPLDSIIPPDLAFHVKQGPWPYNPARAKKLLAEAGYPHGFSTVMWGPVATLAKRGMEFVQQQLAQVGVKVTLEPLEAGVAVQKLWGVKKPQDATMQMDYTGWSASTGDADWGIRPLLYSKSYPPNLFNISYYHSALTDKYIEEGLASADPAKRAIAYAKAQKQAWHDAPWVFLSVDKLLGGEAKNLHGVWYMPDGGILTEHASFK